MIACYIIYNSVLDKYYIGFTQEGIEARLTSHKSGLYDQSYTSSNNSWELHVVIECSSVSQALKIERHIKRMKSRKYIQNLKVYPEIAEKLREKYSDGT